MVVLRWWRVWSCAGARYVIGQENVKMALSVAVHNHYMRLYSKDVAREVSKRCPPQHAAMYFGCWTDY